MVESILPKELDDTPNRYVELLPFELSEKVPLTIL